MKGALRAIARGELAAALRLAGVPTEEVESAAAGAGRVDTLARDPRLAVLLVDDAILARVPDETRRRLHRAEQPVIVAVPSARWAERLEGAEAFVLDILQRAIGYRVRLT
jgi:vacuolar-type H+-ATPase subunit F/Vma7